jgi:glycosyltransferase involved in cell wall biosynthesis
VAISGELREAVLRAGVAAERVVDIPNGIDLQRWQPVTPEQQHALRAQLGLSEGPLIICVGRLSRAKGVPLLLDVWLSLRAEHPRAHLLIVGTGTGSHDDCERELHAACEMSQHREQVIFTGQVENVHEYLQASDIFVQCSEHEGFGLALVEAMACGLPCVTTRVGAAIDVIEPGVNGVLVPIGHREALAAALRDLLASPSQWRPMGRAAHQSAVGRYDMQEVVHRYGELFARLCPPASRERSLLRVPQ